jgi:hypothetical protein
MELAREFGLVANAVEKDFVLGWWIELILALSHSKNYCHTRRTL